MIFFSEKYTEKLKLELPCSGKDFENKPVAGFLRDNFEKIKSYLQYIAPTVNM
jgi:hypothetical protein